MRLIFLKSKELLVVVEQKLFKFVCKKCKHSVVLPLKYDIFEILCPKCDTKMNKTEASFIDKYIIK